MNIIIVGGGLSGLTLAYLLKKKNINATILEASSRLGGRIQTVKGKLETPLELGATWFTDMHTNLIELIQELDLQKYPQYSKGISLFQTKPFEPPQKFIVPETESPSYRLTGGTNALINRLSQKLNADNIKLNSKVIAIEELENNLSVEISSGQKLLADKVIFCLPPQIATQILFSPALPDAVSKILPTVQTWMSGSVKFVLEYEQAFWRKNGYSGMLYSHTGIISEIYDHTNSDENKFGFTGFLNGEAAFYTQEVRKEMVIKQLADLLGSEVFNPISYFDKVWTDEYILAGNPSIQRPHQNNGHPMFQQSYMNGKLFFSGTESATEYAGYMEGAVFSAIKTLDRF